MIELTNLVTLDDDNEYVVAAKTNYENRVYYFFVDINDNKNIKFLYEDGEELVEVDDGKIIEELVPLFADSMREIVSDEALIEAGKMLSNEDIQDILLQIKEDKENNE